jgi:hypothetical protein
MRRISSLTASCGGTSDGKCVVPRQRADDGTPSSAHTGDDLFPQAQLAAQHVVAFGREDDVIAVRNSVATRSYDFALRLTLLEDEGLTQAWKIGVIRRRPLRSRAVPSPMYSETIARGGLDLPGRCIVNRWPIAAIVRASARNQVS